MAKKPLPCPTLVRLFLRYEPETGKLFWKPRARCFFKRDWIFKEWNRQHANQEAFTARCRGYAHGGIQGRILTGHRVAWVITHGRWPKEFIDHINGNPSDNRLENLREATRSENCRNKRSSKNSTSQYLGVNFYKHLGKWAARIKPEHENVKVLGYFEDEKEAAMAYDNAARKIHGEFARLNFPEAVQ